jgi:nitrogenase molybdenum-iron protein alpha/beta subunit/MoaA/NifB/PqqE/SkfB family radical SAM enzyme
MCMPMGAVTAFKGIENSMVILHGSQGCSTYIRRHMAEHYNEPVDIASSSLNEQGTVYGGEESLKKGIKNIIRLYGPSIIGISTTCLAETIGEDIERISDEYRFEPGQPESILVPLHTPGYGGSQFEGYYSALCSIVKTVSRDDRPNGRLNVVTGFMSPGDIRNIKRLLACFGMRYTLLPDISETLDSPYSEEFKKIPEGGTALEDIRSMAGAAATLEMGMTVPDTLSPGRYLLEKYGIPLYKCSLPIGIKNTDKFLSLLSMLSGRPVPPSIQKERGRLLDGMIDSHKYNGEGRAVIFGEPEFVCAVTSLCVENGVRPVLVCTGAENAALKALLEREITADAPTVLDDTDFETITKLSGQLGANILIGNSDGKVITEKLGIPLVRAGYPIHDRVGGQRLVFSGYDGSLRLLDEITNTLLEKKHSGYRKEAYEKYHSAAAVKKAAGHPCFDAGSCGSARMHIPVAPACNIACNYCSRKYDCINESRPGITSEILTPEQAAEKFAAVKSRLKNLSVVGIAGPGDALADFENTRRSVELIKKLDPGMTFCLSTNGLMLPAYAQELAGLGIGYVTITVNAVDPAVGAKIYREVSYRGRRLTGAEAAGVLLENQLEGLSRLTALGIVCKVNIVLIKGINDGHAVDVVKKVKELGAHMSNIMPLIPAEGSVFENMPTVSDTELKEVRRSCGAYLKQMYHCRQCRADAIGTLDCDRSSEFRSQEALPCAVQDGGKSGGHSRTFAVASRSGRYVDLHFGHAKEFLIYRYDGSKAEMVEKRTVEKYCSGAGECPDETDRIERTLKAVAGCDAVIALRIGVRPSQALEKMDVAAVQGCGSIEDNIRAVYENIEKIGGIKHAETKIPFADMLKLKA